MSSPASKPSRRRSAICSASPRMSRTRRLPLEVICVLLGLPRQDSDVFSVWAKTATSMRSSFGMFRAFLSMRGVVDYVRGQIEECRLHPREGVIGELVRAEEDGIP